MTNFWTPKNQFFAKNVIFGVKKCLFRPFFQLKPLFLAYNWDSLPPAAVFRVSLIGQLIGFQLKIWPESHILGIKSMETPRFGLYLLVLGLKMAF
jgi:hypothetical protein